MAKEDDNLQLWFDRLRTMQSCMRQINLDTPEDLKPFYGTTHASLLFAAFCFGTAAIAEDFGVE